MAQHQLVRRLHSGPLDVVGDIHGERQALERLLEKLGYDSRGSHPDARRLVFVGDFCDRGPDSPGVLRLVRSLVDTGCASAIAGNHELNLLRGERKHGNHWFFGISSDPEFGDCVAIVPEERPSILKFLRSLPLVLERDDLRVVHAAWIDSAVDSCRSLNLPLDEAFQHFDALMRSSDSFHDLKARNDAQLRCLPRPLSDRAATPAAPAVGRYDEFCQMANPIRVITSGVEQASDEPFYAAGKWRFVRRVPWWQTYGGNVPVLFGHYWRWWNPSAHPLLSKGEPQLFPDDPVGPSMTDEHRAFCIDFSVGSRWKQRRLRHQPPYYGRLAAMRWPERQLIFDGEAPRSKAARESLKGIDT